MQSPPLRWAGHLAKRELCANSNSGVAVGSSIGHAVGGWFAGSVDAPAEAQDNGVASQQAQDGSYQNNSWAQQSCEPAAKGLTTCLDQNNGNMQICTWYLEQLVSWLYSENVQSLTVTLVEILPSCCEPVLDIECNHMSGMRRGRRTSGHSLPLANDWYSTLQQVSGRPSNLVENGVLDIRASSCPQCRT